MRNPPHAVRLALVLLLAAPAALASPAPSAGPSSAARKGATVRMMSLPLSFEANCGQFDPRVRFVTRFGGATTFLTDREAVMVLPGKPIGNPVTDLAGGPPTKRGPGAVLRMKLVGAAKAPASAGAQKLPGIANYYLGKNPKAWRTRVPTYRQARFASVYPGTDLVYYGNPNRLEYDFLLRPGADPGRIRLAFEGAHRLRVAANGDLIATTSAGDVCWKRPFAYQMHGARRVQVACDYSLAPGSHGVSFRLARYDARRPLVVDPSLAWATLLGGSGADRIRAVAVSDSGTVYVTGDTTSTNFPVTAGGYQSASAGAMDVYLTAISSTGASVLSSTYLGGTSDESGFGVALSNGGACIAGYTLSSDFPTTGGAFQPSAGGGMDAFVARLTADGSALTYSTYLGGAGPDFATCLAAGASGAVTVAGYGFEGFPTTEGAFQRAFAGGTQDGFVARLSPEGAALEFSTLLGGLDADQCYAVAIDSAGATCVAGSTSSTDFPTTPGAYASPTANASNMFVTRINSAGSALIASTVIGGPTDDFGMRLAIDADGAAFVAGHTGGGFPVTAGAYSRAFKGGTYDVAVLKLSPDGSALQYSTYLGGTGVDYAGGIGVDLDGSAYVTGYTTSTTFPTTADGYKRSNTGAAGTYDQFLTKLNPTGSALLYSTHFGGTLDDYALALAQDLAGGVYIAGRTTSSSTYPTTVGAYQRTNAGGSDGCIARFQFAVPTALAVPEVAGAPGAAVTLSATLTAGGAGLTAQTVAFTVDGVSAGSAVTGDTGLATLSYTIPEGASTGTQTIGAAYAGDATYSATSGTGPLVVGQRATTLAAADATGRLGRNVTLSATLTAGGAAVAGRTVLFTVDGTAAGSGTTDASGVATVTCAIAADGLVGTRSIGAAFAGDSANQASSGSATLTVQAAAGATSVYASPKTAQLGARVTFTAEVFDATRAGAKLAGRTVSFQVDGATIGSAITTAGSGGSVQAALAYTTTGLSLGSHTITAVFAGDADYNGSSGSAALTMEKVTTRLTVNDRYVTRGDTLNLVGFLSRPGGYVIGAEVTFKVDGTVVGQATTRDGGLAFLACTFNEAIGTHAISAEFAGDGVFLPSSASSTLIVSGIPTAVTALDVSATRASTITLRGTLSRNGGYVLGAALTFKVDGATVGTGTTAGGGVATCSYTVTPTVGTHTLVTEFAGDGTYLASSATKTLTVGLNPTSLYVAPKAGEIAGRVLLTATLYNGSTRMDGRTIAFSINGTVVGSATTSSGTATLPYTIPEALGPGSHTITADFAGDATYAAAAGSAAFTVTKAATAITSSDVFVYRNTTVALKGTLTHMGGYVAGRTVTFKLAGNVLGSATTDESGVATFNYNATFWGGSFYLDTEFAGDSVYAASSSRTTIVISKWPTSLYVAPKSGPMGGTAILTATLYQGSTKLEGKSVSFAIDGTNLGSATTSSAGVASLNYTIPDALGVGSHTITCDYDGDGVLSWCRGTSTLEVARATPRLDVPAVSAVRGYNTRLLAVLSRTGGYLYFKRLVFKLDGTQIGTDNTDSYGRGIVDLVPDVAAGTHTLTVEFAGDAANLPVTQSSTLVMERADSYIYVPSVSKEVYANALIGGRFLQTGLGGYDGRTLSVSIDGASIGTATTDWTGVGTVAYAIPDSLAAGDHTIAVSFAGDGDVAPSTGVATLTVSKATPFLTVPNATVAAGRKVQLVGVLSRNGGYAVGRTLTFKLNGAVVGSAITNAGGKAMIIYTAPDVACTATLTVEFAGDTALRAATATSTLTVTP